MTAKEFYQAGRLAEAVAKLGEDIRNNPADQGARIFLFELLCFSGDLVRAEKQLDAVAVSDTDAENAFAGYRNLLAAEAIRRDVHLGKHKPQIPEPVPAYAVKHVEALKFVALGNVDAAKAQIEEAQALIPAIRVRVNGEAFDNFGDSDDVLRPFLEAMIDGVYCWIPWQSIRSLSLPQPKNLRDLYWIPARLEMNSGEAGNTYLPVLYAGSYLNPNDQIRLGRQTDWRTDVPGLSLGTGQRVLDAGDTEMGILEISELEIDHAVPSNPS